MRLINYHYQGNELNPIIYSSIHLENINLIVGDTGSGKSKFLNTITNLEKFVTKDSFELKTGKWDISFSIKNNIYNWKLIIGLENNKPAVIFEKLSKIDDNNETIYLVRKKNSFVFFNKELPLFSRNFCSINLLKDDPQISVIYHDFAKIIDRRFDMDTLRDATVLNVINPNSIDSFNKKNINEIAFSNEFNLNSKLFLLKKLFPSKYNEIVKVYMEIFPFITNVDICDYSEVNSQYSAPGITPVFRIKEKYIPKEIDLTQLSSGMKKVLMILTDIILMDKDSVYLIDEYENSLGISAINFLPDYLLEKVDVCQLIITSHHPYLINNFPVRNWLLFSRKGSEVNIIPGQILEKEYARSKQESFIQLINDPRYISD